MNNLKKCFRFQTRNLIKNTLTFLFIYTIIIVGFLSITMSHADVRISSFRSSFFIGSMFFVFIFAAADYRSTFNYLLIYGNTRKTIYLSTVMTNIALSVTMAVLSGLLAIADTIIDNLVPTIDSIDFWAIHLLYPNSNIATELLFMAGLFLLTSAFASLYGSLAYKLGKYFITPFWICFGLAVMLIPATGMSEPAFFQSMVKIYFCLGNPNGALLAPVNFLAAALVFSLGTYLVSSRQPQTAPVS